MTESAIAIKLPNFWVSQPRAWFTQAEAQFTLRKITEDNTKYCHLVAALDQQTAERLLDVLESPPQEGKYEKLKARLLGTFDLTEQQRASRLLGMTGLGDRRPSELMDEMLSLLGNHRPCMLFVELFRQQLPPDVRMSMANADFGDLRAAAQEADALWASRLQPVAAVVQQPAQPIQTVQEPTVSAAGRSNSRRFYNRSSRQQAADNVCQYHRRFGAKARRCYPPCSFQGNDEAGRQ